MQHKDLWLVDLETGAERQLTNLAEFDIRDFDVSSDGREVVLERMCGAFQRGAARPSPVLIQVHLRCNICSRLARARIDGLADRRNGNTDPAHLLVSKASQRLMARCKALLFASTSSVLRNNARALPSAWCSLQQSGGVGAFLAPLGNTGQIQSFGSDLNTTMYLLYSFGLKGFISPV